MKSRKMFLLLSGMILGLVTTGAMAQSAKQVEVEVGAIMPAFSEEVYRRKVLETGDKRAYDTLSSCFLVDYKIEPPEEQIYYNDNLRYALIMANKYHYLPAYSDVFDYIYYIYKSNDMPMDSIAWNFAFSYLQKGAELGSIGAYLTLITLYKTENQYLPKDSVLAEKWRNKFHEKIMESKSAIMPQNNIEAPCEV